MQKLVLVVDDIEDLRQQAIYSLSMIYPKAAFIEASNGIQAIEKFIKHKPDLILLDIEMPEMDGLQVLKRIRQNRDKKINKVPVVMFTGVVTKNTVDQIVNLGVEGYLVKPYELEDLYKKVDKFLKDD